MAAVFLVVVVLAGCAGPDETGTPSQRMRSWVESTGLGGTIGTLQADGQRVRAVVADHVGAAAIRTDCAVLTTDAESANSNLPTPDYTLTQELSDAFTLDGQAGNDCYAAGTGNAALMDRSARERTKADALFQRALVRVRMVSGLTVSTTTTTQGSGGSPF